MTIQRSPANLGLPMKAVVLGILGLFLSGCGFGTGPVTSTRLSSTSSTSQAMTGSVHGGQQPVTGAVVTLWAAGVTGTGAASYGAHATLVASTVSDLNGNFSFNTAGVSPCTAGQYLYVTAVGGNTGSGINTSSAMMAALPTPCGAATAGTFVFVNEASTVAAVWALQQFMSISPGGATPWQIGAPSTNVTGLANAFLLTSNLVNVASGQSATSATSNKVTSIVNGVVYTTTVNPDYLKINTLADILAYCINSTGNLCGALFSDVTPGSSSAPTDTIQAAYYLATNSAGLTMNAHGNTQGSPYYLCATYVTPAPPFLGTLTCTTASYPTDWMIGVSYTALNASSTNAGTAYVGNIAVDGSGNIWTAYSTGTGVATGLVSQMNVLGQVVMTPVTSTTISPTLGWYGASYYAQTGAPTTVPLGAAKGYSLAIDTSNNAWYAGYYTAAQGVNANLTAGSGGTLETPIAQISPSGVSTGYLVADLPTAIAVDGSNNVWVTSATNETIVSPPTGRWFVTELLGPSGSAALATPAPAYSTFYTGWDRSGGYYGQLVVDSTGNQYVDPIYQSCPGSIIQGNTASAVANPTPNTTANASTSTVSPFTTTSGSQNCVTTVAVDPSGNLWGTYFSGAVGYLEYVNIAAGTVTGTPPTTTVAPVISQFLMGTNGATQGGLDNPSGVAIDGTGNVWVSNYVSTTSGGVSEFVPSSNGTVVTPLSPAGTGIYGFGTAYKYPRPLELVIDPSGNIWIGTGSGATALNFLVGAAAPVVTPTATALANHQLAVRP
jgi:hypothetical protein